MILAATAVASFIRDPCDRLPQGAAVPEPPELRSVHGILEVNLSIHDFREPDGTVRYCYLLPDGRQSPTLRLSPGDSLILRLTNNLTDLEATHAHADHAHKHTADPCKSGAMTPTATNLHFHGLSVPPVCHQDDVLRTSVQPGDSPFEYRFQIPANQPPGLYWYHPHIHGFSSRQVLGGASGPRKLIDRDGDAANTGTGFGKPAKDLSINFVPVPYPDYPPATIRMKPGERQLWRVVNAASVTYLNLAVIFGRAPQKIGLVAIDGVPMNVPLGKSPPITWIDHIAMPPGARAEFIMEGPPVGTPALLVTRTVDTGQGGENDPNRALATIVAAVDSPEPQSKLPAFSQPLQAPALPWLGDVEPVRVRRFYFSEKLSDPKDPNSATGFFITEDGKTPAPFDPAASVPDIVAQQGDVEDWIIENRSTELQAFHIHQLHFALMELSGRVVNEPLLRDTLNVGA